MKKLIMAALATTMLSGVAMADEVIPVGTMFTADESIDYIIPGNVLTKTENGWIRTYGDYTSSTLPASS